MGRFLNVGVIQMPCSEDTAVNLKWIEEKTDMLMQDPHKPDLVVGVECMEAFTPDTIPGIQKIKTTHDINIGIHNRKPAADRSSVFA